MSSKAHRSRRRDFVRYGGAFSVSAPGVSLSGAEANVYQRLGIPTLIHAQGYTTVLGGSVMPAEVRRAMDEASRHFVRLEDLQRKVGERLARITGAEFAMVTSGAAGAIALGTAACMTGKDGARIKRLPDTSGMKSEVIIQRNRRNGFDHAARRALAQG